MRTALNGPQASAMPGHPDPGVYVPVFKKEHKDPNGRVFKPRKVPQSNMFEITAEGKGDLPHRLKGSFTSLRAAEVAVKGYLDSLAKEAKQEKVDVFAKVEEPAKEPDTQEPVKVETPETPEPVEVQEPAKEEAKKTLTLKK